MAKAKQKSSPTNWPRRTKANRDLIDFWLAIKSANFKGGAISEMMGALEKDVNSLLWNEPADVKSATRLTSEAMFYLSSE